MTRPAPKRPLPATSSGPSPDAADGTSAAARSGPDPVIGAGLTLLGIFLMGTGGATDAHYLFNFGELLALVGAVTYVVLVTLSALKQRRSS